MVENNNKKAKSYDENKSKKDSPFGKQKLGILKKIKNKRKREMVLGETPAMGKEIPSYYLKMGIE